MHPDLLEGHQFQSGYLFLVSIAARGEQTIYISCVGSELHPAQPTPYPYLLLCHPLTPSCTRIYEERALSQGDASTTSALKLEAARLATWRRRCHQAACHQSLLHQTLESTWGAWQRSAGIRGSAISTGQLTCIP